MIGFTKLPKKKLYGILIPIGIIMMVASLEVLMKVKDYSVFQSWLSGQVIDEGMTEEDLFSIYLTANTALYFMKIIIPIGLGIHAYFAYVKVRINKMFVFIWMVLMAGSAAYGVMGNGFQSVISYVYIVLYLIVIGTVFSLITDIEQNENL